MTSHNGIISGKINLGTGLTRIWSDEKCRRVYSAARRALRAKGWDAEDEAFLINLIKGQVATGNTFGVPFAQALTSAILEDLRESYTDTTRIPASPETLEWDQTNPGFTCHDRRAADDVLRQVIAA